MKTSYNKKKSMTISLVFLFGLLLFLPREGYAKAFDGKKKSVNQKFGPSGRGLVAIPKEDGTVYIGWRLLKDDPENIAFNLYRRSGNGSATKLNGDPLDGGTNFVDENPPEGQKFSYTVRPVINGEEGEASKPYQVTPKIGNSQPYLRFDLQGDYDFQKIGIADLDGEGSYDYVIKQPNINQDPWYKYWDPSQGTYKLEAYRQDGKHLWTYDMGWAIERGIWYSPYIVYDLNQDGKAEVAVKSGEDDPRNAEGKVESGPEYLSVLDGTTGEQIDKIDWVSRDPFYDMNPEHGYNYASRNQLGVAYLDGENPYLIVERGTYNLIIVRAYRLKGDELELVWEWDNRDASDDYWGQGAHWLHSVDVDEDGKQEVILGSAVLDDDGTELWSTGFGHPDHLYVGDLMPDRPGLEIYYGVESGMDDGNGMCMVDAQTGEVIWGIEPPTNHVHGKGLASDIDPVHPGREFYGAESEPSEGKRLDFAMMHNNQGEIIDRDVIGGFSPFSVHWDSDNQRELLVDGRIYDYPNDHTHRHVEGDVIAIVDLFGDWREEIITAVEGEFRIYSTTIHANDRRVSLMEDPIYRMDVAHFPMGYESVPTTTEDLPFK